MSQNNASRETGWHGKCIGQGPDKKKSGMVQGIQNTSPGPTFHRNMAKRKDLSSSHGETNELKHSDRLLGRNLGQ